MVGVGANTPQCCVLRQTQVFMLREQRHETVFILCPVLPYWFPKILLETLDFLGP